ncbi:MAG TPA: hypothetical protein VFH77_10260 [Streptomyces sp.]|nr:hypothetical protein [Streptomyces sp.]
MLDTTALVQAVERYADRLRATPQSRLRQGAARQGLALARELTYRAQRLETPDATLRELPDAGIFTVGDQVAVTGHDLAEALAATDDEAALTDAVRLVTTAAARM